jgi:hypothetical protein
LRHSEVGNNADQCLPVFLHLHRLRVDATAEVWRLLRVLFAQLGSVPADAGGAFGIDKCVALLCPITVVAAKLKREARIAEPRRRSETHPAYTGPVVTGRPAARHFWEAIF